MEKKEKNHKECGKFLCARFDFFVLKLFSFFFFCFFNERGQTWFTITIDILTLGNKFCIRCIKLFAPCCKELYFVNNNYNGITLIIHNILLIRVRYASLMHEMSYI